MVLQYIQAGVGVASALSGVFGGSGDKAARKAAAYNAMILRINARRAREKSKNAIERGDWKAAWSGQQTAQKLGAQRVALAANGLDVNQDSALQLQADTAQLGRYDQLLIEHDALTEALGYQVQAAQFDAQSAAEEAKARQKSSTFKTISRVITAGVGVAKAIYPVIPSGSTGHMDQAGRAASKYQWY